MNFLETPEEITRDTLLSKISKNETNESTTQEDSNNLIFHKKLNYVENFSPNISFKSKKKSKQNQFNIYYNSQRSNISKPDKFDILNETESENDIHWIDNNDEQKNQMIFNLLSKRDQKNIILKSSNISRKKIESYRSKSIQKIVEEPSVDQEAYFCSVNDKSLSESMRKIRNYILGDSLNESSSDKNKDSVYDHENEFLTFGNPETISCGNKTCTNCKFFKQKLLNDFQSQFPNSEISKNDLLNILSKFIYDQN